MSPQESAPLAFSQLALSAGILAALDEVGYETPTAIQAEAIPVLLAGRDLIGQAQTGTGKTAAFALPLLSTIDISRTAPQALVLTPTRELAIQVAEAFQRYANHLPGFHVLPIYGGQEYGVQLRALRRGVHVVVGTPGRVMDHIRRETLGLEALRHLVLDEADEMLRMGFIDDVEWVLERIPASRQIALFSATMPRPIRKIAERYLREPAEVSIRLSSTTAATIRQRYWMVSGLHKLDALTRILEAEDFGGVLIFVRTKTATLELAERLEARGFASGAINGDMPQKARERTIEQLKRGKLDILVATDVAARGLDVERISHVINYDIPYDPESYVHRVGRTGRAGRHGDAILFVTSREARMLRVIEKATRQPIERMDLPSAETINDVRRARFMKTISDTLANEDLEPYAELVMRYQREHDTAPLSIAAALARMLQGDAPLLLETEPKRAGKGRRRPCTPEPKPVKREKRAARPRAPEPEQTRPADGRPKQAAAPPKHTPAPPKHAPAAPKQAAPQEHRGAAGSQGPAPRRESRPRKGRGDADIEIYRIEVGRSHGVLPGNIVGAIANEAGLDAADIGRVDILEDHSIVELPSGMPKEIFNHLKRVWVAGQPLRIRRAGDPPAKPARKKRDEPSGAKPRKKERHRDRKNKGARKKP